MDQYLIKTIENVGFSELESKVLLALFSLGDGTAAEVAKRSSVNRSTTYLTLQVLAGRGYVTELPSHKVKRFVPADPSKLLSVSREHVENLRFMLPAIQALYNRSGSKPRIEFYQGADAVMSVWQTFGNALEARYLSSYNRLRESFGNKIDRWAESVLNGKTKTRVRQLLVQDHEGLAFAKLLSSSSVWENRFLVEGAQGAMDLAIVDDRLVITSFDPISIVVMNSKSLADSMKLIFDMAWSTAIPAKSLLDT